MTCCTALCFTRPPLYTPRRDTKKCATGGQRRPQRTRHAARASCRYYTSTMETAEKLRQLGAGAAYEVAAATTSGRPPTASEPGICRVAGRGRRPAPPPLVTPARVQECHLFPPP